MDDCSMEHCMLSDIPDAPFQAILHQLISQDHASLRLVSRPLSQRTTLLVPYISLQLAENSNAVHLQQWCQVTRPFQHVASVQVHITGDVPAEVFELTMQMLLQHISITELHVLGQVVSDRTSDDRALLTTLQPIKHVLSHLQTLVIKNVMVNDLPADLEQLGTAAAAIGGWPLQKLTLEVVWNFFRCFDGENRALRCLWSRLSAGMTHMSAAFPKLQTLALRMPPVAIKRSAPAAADLCCSVIAGDQSDWVHEVDAAYVFGGGWSLNFWDMKLGAQAASALVAALAALTNAVLQLKGLRALFITGAPDVWRPVGLLTEVNQGGSTKRASAIAVAAKLAAARASSATTDAAAVPTGASSYPGQLWTVSAAAAAFTTFDSYGCWLLQHHPALQALHVSCAHISTWSMTWEKQQQQSCRSSSSHAVSGDASELVEAHMDWNIATTILKPTSTQAGASNNISNSSQGCEGESLSSAFLNHLTHYSPRPASLWKGKLTSCRVCLSSYQVDGVADVLSDLKSVKHLEVVVSPAFRIKSYDVVLIDEGATIAAVKAAAVLPILQSLCIRTGDSHLARAHQSMPPGLLLPLTGSMGGSSLQKLEISGVLTPHWTSAFGRDDFVDGNCGWLHCLRQLKELRELSILNKDHKLYNISAGELPATLQKFRGQKLYITAPEALAAIDEERPSRSSPRKLSRNSSDHDTVRHAASPDLQLKHLHLEKCLISSHVHGALASRQLQQLTIIDSSWSGGWAAATAVWPNVRDLVWIFDGQFSSMSGIGISRHYRSSHVPIAPEQKATEMEPSSSTTTTTSSSGSNKIDKAADVLEAKLLDDSEVAHKVLQDLLTGFRSLRAITLEYLPWLNVDVFNKSLLQDVVHGEESVPHNQMLVCSSGWRDSDRTQLWRTVLLNQPTEQQFVAS